LCQNRSAAGMNRANFCGNTHNWIIGLLTSVSPL